MTRSLDEVPGPRQLPLIGNLHQVDLARLHHSAELLSDKHGSFYRLRLGRRTMLAVSDPIAIGKILKDRPDGFRRSQLLEEVFREMGLAGVFATNGDIWRAQRKMVGAAFDPRHIKAYFPSLARSTERLYRRWCDHADRGTAFDLQADLMRFTVDAVAGVAFGADLNTIESDRETIQTHLNRVFPMLQRRLTSPIPYWRWVRLPVDRALDRSLCKLQTAVTALIKETRERLMQKPELRIAPANLLEAMLVERDSPGTPLTDDDVSSNVLTMLVAGEDTTANTLAWLVYLASKNPAAIRRLGEEADRVLGEAHWPTRLEIASAHRYASACAHETMRLKPVAPLLIVQALRPVVVGDIAIPTGTVLMAILRPGAMDARYFERPDTFEPERWLDSGGSQSTNTVGERISMPFGAGPRICPGRNLALLEMNMVTSMLFRNFEVTGLRTPDGAEVKEWFALAMAPSKLLVTLARR
jgi:cytochrome P450